MRKAIISDGVVVNIVVANDTWLPPDGVAAVDDDGTAEVGGVYVDGKFGPAPRPEVTKQEVNRERDRRAAQSFTFAGAAFQARPEDQKRINGAGTLALAAIVGGAQPGNLRWHGGDADFAWIGADNKLMAMDAHTVMAFGQAAARWESLHVFAARALKQMAPIPADFSDDKYWPRSQ